MFTETNEIELVLVNIDGLIKFDGEHAVPIIANLVDVLTYLEGKYELKIVSSFNDDELAKNLRHCFGKRFPGKRFAASNSIEEFVVNGQIIRGLSSSGKRPCNCVYISADIDTISQAQSLRLGTIYWDCKSIDDEDKIRLLRKGPDFVVDDEQELKDVFEKKYLGFLGEALATPVEFFTGRQKKAYLNTIRFPNKELPKFPIQVSGRYFRVNDPRNRKHALSLRILDSKNHMGRQKEVLARIIGEMILYLVGEDFDYITRIPPKPSQTEDRIKEEIEYIPTLNFENRRIPIKKVKADLLKCIRDYTPQKEMAYDAKRENVRGAFKLKENVKGKTVVIVDDVTTSGSTLMEATQLLDEGEAKKIIPMALSYHPNNLTPSDEVLACPTCGSKLLHRHRNDSGKPFYGCENYFDTGCKGGMDFCDGVRELNRKIELESEDFVDIDF